MVWVVLPVKRTMPVPGTKVPSLVQSPARLRLALVPRVRVPPVRMARLPRLPLVGAVAGRVGALAAGPILTLSPLVGTPPPLQPVQLPAVVQAVLTRPVQTQAA